MTCYFSGVIPLEQMDEIISHLITCKKCKKKYWEYANKIGVKFNLIREVQKIYNLCEVKNMEANNINNLINSGVIARKIIGSNKKWQQFAQEKDVAALSNLKCVADFFTEDFEVGDKQEFKEAVALFGWYKVKEMCRLVDLLEGIYKLSGGDDKNA